MAKSSNEQVVFVVGPTASGKTGFAESLIKKYNAEIINADSAQLYSPFSTGIAKPEQTSGRGHLFDSVSQAKTTNVMCYRNSVKKVIQQVWDRGKVPLVVGGSFFYVKQLLFKLQQPESWSDAKKKKHELSRASIEILSGVTEEDLESWRTGILFSLLDKIDSKRAQEVGKTDRYRIVRALQIAKKWKIAPSVLKEGFEPIADKNLIIAIMPQQNVLDERIRRRMDLMIGGEGDCWIEEVRKLGSTEWKRFAIEKGFIGYDDLFSWVDAGEDLSTLQNVKDKIFIKTRKYSKRQVCFWKKLKVQLQEADGNGQVSFLEILDSTVDVDLSAVFN